MNVAAKGRRSSGVAADLLPMGHGGCRGNNAHFLPRCELLAHWQSGFESLERVSCWRAACGAYLLRQATRRPPVDASAGRQCEPRAEAAFAFGPGTEGRMMDYRGIFE